MTYGSPIRLLAVFALPMLIGNIFQQAYNLADSIIVGKYIGASALAAVGSTGSVTFLFFSISNGISSGCGIITSQYFGAGEDNKVRQAIANAAYIMFGTALIMALTAFALTKPALRFMNTPDDIYADAVRYMQISCLGVPLVSVFNYASSMLRALGDSKTPLYFLIISCFLNILIDILFVYQLEMGVFGAALATVIAQLIAGIGCLIYAVKRNSYFMLTRADWKFDPKIVKKSIRLGLPLAMQWSLISISSIGLQSFVNGFGTATMAAFTSVSRIEQFMHQPYSSLSMALSTYAGQNYGAKKLDRIKAGIDQGLIAAIVYSFLMMIVFQFLGSEIISIFVKEKEVIEIGGQALRMTSWFYLALAVIYIIRGTLNGVGDALFSFINGFVEMVCRIALPRLIVLIPGIGLVSIWWTAGITWVISAVFCVLRYITWRKKNILSRAAA